MKSTRKSGVLMPIASLPGKYGIGTLGQEAYDFVNRLKEAGQSYWQILPLGPTSYGDSPYQSFSTFAGNPYFIDPDKLIEEGLLTRKEADAYDLAARPMRRITERYTSRGSRCSGRPLSGSIAKKRTDMRPFVKRTDSGSMTMRSIWLSRTRSEESVLSSGMSR